MRLLPLSSRPWTCHQVDEEVVTERPEVLGHHVVPDDSAFGWRGVGTPVEPVARPRYSTSPSNAIGPVNGLKFPKLSLRSNAVMKVIQSKWGHMAGMPGANPDDDRFIDRDLPTDGWELDDTVPVPAKRGEVVIFHYHAIHGSWINQADSVRRMARIGYCDPENLKFEGQSKGRPSLMVRGRRPRAQGQTVYATTI